jgi:hypothetical protein
MAYYFRDGTEWKGDVCVLPDGRIVSGSSYTSDSKRVVEEKPVAAPVRARAADGGFKADDKSTLDVNEAWVGGKAPAKKAAKKGK